jgi:hypothetical protein
VVRGFEQVEGIDCGETFAPVARLTSFSMLVATAVEYEMQIHHLDVVTAFLNPEIDGDVYLTIPQGFDWLDENLSQQLSPTSTLKLRKALYGLKQAPRLWYQNINKFLKEIGFTPSGSDPNLYL